MSTGDFESDIVFPAGVKVRSARKKLELTLNQASASLGNNDGSFLSRVERGTYEPNLETKLMLVRLLEDGGLRLSDIASEAQLELVSDTPAT
jgi:DNA-binding XRE family transcriptional regulator